MSNDIEQIIKNLLSTETAIIQKATDDLNESYKNPATIPALCDIIVTNQEPQIRQYSAVLLSKRLGKLRNWQMVPPEQQQIIKKGILSALVQEPEKSVRNSIAMFVGALVRHEADKKDSWMNDLLQFIFTRCSSADPKESELGSSIFATLTDSAPDQFVPHMESIFAMFTHALLAAEANGNMATPVIANIMSGMIYLTPFVLGHQTAEQALNKAMPLVLKALHAFAYSSDPDQFVRTFEMLDGMAEFTPKLLNNSFKSLMEFCLEVANNTQLDNTVRVQCIMYVGRLVRLKKKAFVKNKFVEPTLLVVFAMMCDENTMAEDEEDYFSGDAGSCPISAGSQTLDMLALNLSPDQLIPPLLQLLEPALQGEKEHHRRAAYLCMAVIAEGCSDAIINKYLETMLNILKVGILDNSPIVRNTAFFALGQFAEHLQPEISKFASQVLPVLLEFLHQLCEELKRGLPEPLYIGRMFYALETFCENLEVDIVSHLPLLMERLFECLNPQNTVRLRELALSVVSAAATAAKEHLMPYFQQLISVLQTYLVKSDNEDIIVLRTQTIDTLSAIARAVGTTNFYPLANDTMSFCIALLEDKIEDPDCRRAVYNMIGSLSTVVKEDMASAFPQIMNHIIDSVISTQEVVPKFKETENQHPILENDDEIDIEDTDDEDDEDNIVVGYNVENDYLCEKEEAINCLKEFSIHAYNTFAQYLETSFENVYKMIDHSHEDIRKAAIEALTFFVIALHKLNNFDGVKKANMILIPKILNMLREEEDIGVPIFAIETLTDFMKELKEYSLPSEELYDSVFSLISDVLANKLACQFDDPGDGSDVDDEEGSELAEALIQAAGNMLPDFGHTMSNEQFAMYFGRIYPFFIRKLKKARKDEDMADQRAFVYGALAECISPLGKYSGTYFNTLCPVFIDGLSDKEARGRQNACFGLGELVLHSEENSFGSYPVILQALSEALAKESTPSVLDNICGAVARLILTNHSMVPLSQVLPVLVQNLPLREDFHENEAIFRCFRILYLQAQEAMVNSIEQILAITIQVLYKKEFPDQDTCDHATTLLKEIRVNYPEKFEAVANSNPEIQSFVQSI